MPAQANIAAKMEVTIQRRVHHRRGATLLSTHIAAS